MSESEDIINLTIIEDDITEAMKGNDKGYLIMIESEKDSTSLNSETEMILKNLKSKFLDEAIAFYKINISTLNKGKQRDWLNILKDKQRI